MKTLREIMRPSFLFPVQKTAVVLDAVRVMSTNNVGIVVVLDGDVLVGVFSERDVVQRVVNRGFDPACTMVADVMTTAIVVGEADEDWPSAMRKMDQANVRHLPVVSGGQLLSMISIRDLTRLELADKGQELEYLRAYLHQIPPDTASPTYQS